MNRLALEKRIQITSMLVEGSSLRSISRVVSVSINTVTKLLVDLGKACQQYHDENVKDISATKIQCDEIWSFIYAKDKNLPDGLQGKFGLCDGSFIRISNHSSRFTMTMVGGKTNRLRHFIPSLVPLSILILYSLLVIKPRCYFFYFINRISGK